MRAALGHGDVGLERAPALGGQAFQSVRAGEAGEPLPGLSPGDERGQVGDPGRAEREVRSWADPEDLPAAALGHAPPDPDHAGPGSPQALQLPDAAHDLVLRALADHARVEEDHIGLTGRVHQGIPGLGEDPGDLLALVLVELTAPGQDARFHRRERYPPVLASSRGHGPCGERWGVASQEEPPEEARRACSFGQSRCRRLSRQCRPRGKTAVS